MSIIIFSYTYIQRLDTKILYENIKNYSKNDKMYEKLQTTKNILPKILLNIIAEYASEYIFIDFVKKNLDKVDWRWLSQNKNAIHILEKI